MPVAVSELWAAAGLTTLARYDSKGQNEKLSALRSAIDDGVTDIALEGGLNTAFRVWFALTAINPHCPHQRCAMQRPVLAIKAPSTKDFHAARRRDQLESMIRQVANAGIGRSDVLKFWFGESDGSPSVHPGRCHGIAAEGEVFYTHNLLDLPGGQNHRRVLQRPRAGRRGRWHGPGRCHVGGGVKRVVCWPCRRWSILATGGGHLGLAQSAQPAIMGAVVRCVSLQPVAGQWQLNMVGCWLTSHPPVLADHLTNNRRLDPDPH
jgi:hypothetical protein